jgi:hypothetical protein
MSGVDTGGKFAAGVIDTGGNLLPLSPAPILPPVSLAPVASLPLLSTTKKWEQYRLLS